MTDAQPYLAIGIPSALFALNFLAILWQARGMDRRIDAFERAVTARFGAMDTRFDALEKIMNAKFDAQTQGLLRVEQVIDARLKHLEER